MLEVVIFMDGVVPSKIRIISRIFLADITVEKKNLSVPQ